MSALVACSSTPSPGVDALLVQLEEERKRTGKSEPCITKSLGTDECPRVILSARMGVAGTPVGSVRVERTYGRKDPTCSLDDLEIRTACAYFMSLTANEDLDAIEKAVRAPTPKAWAFIALLDRMKSQTKELT